MTSDEEVQAIDRRQDRVADNPVARLAQEFPLDRKSVEVQEMVKSPVNNGHPYLSKAALEL